MRYGYFDNKNREYVIERPDIPVSWTNYLGTKDFCTVISQNAGGYSFYKSAQHHRITRFRANAVPLDRPGHYLYLRDEDDEDYWSVSWQPVGKNLDEADYEVRHGLSYSKFKCNYRQIEAEKTIFVPLDDDLEIWDIKIKNNSDLDRQLSLFSYLEFSFHEIDIDNQNFQMSLYSAGSSYQDGIIEYDFYYDPRKYHYFTANFEADSYDCLRDQFIGSYRDESNPIALERGICSNSSKKGGNHCAALNKRFNLAAGEEKRFVLILGVGRRELARKMRKKYSDFTNLDTEFDRLNNFWEEKLSNFQCSTPHQDLDTMINTWNPYQAETCAVWSRFASFVEVGGRTGLGYRDTAQDSLAVAHTNPEKTKERLIQLLRGQTIKGYGLHLFDPDWFDPEAEELEFESPTVVPEPDMEDVIHGIEDTCSDDALWLVAAVCNYVKETNDLNFFDQVISYADEGEDTVYNHLKKILDFSAEQIGGTGICKGLRADWNDCLNLGGGESAMVSFLHHWALEIFIETAEFLNKKSDVEKYSEIAARVKKVCEENLWDGGWYLRGITGSGNKIGSKENSEGKVHLESNTWAVISNVAARERAVKAMDSVDEYLYSEYGLHLNAPSYTEPDDEIGFVTRVYPGIKENGSIFSHPNPWAWIAEAKLGRGNRAIKFYNALLPASQNDEIETREAEPYSYCQFIMGKDHEDFGRARHPWLTGSSGWAYRAVTQWILGVRISYQGLIIDPCIPSDWEEFEIKRKWRGAEYNIKVKNPDSVKKGVKEITLNGKTVNDIVPQQEPGTVNKISVIMG
ncbi:chitobiose phosphorylase [Halanaerobium saccharolyticum]|uniref:Chitobiose phosphorylase n=1 Tax=Halanaerobium saccharolyticum TaxID=43595 RepID=A0A4R6LCT0_9FIRM|nr:GH116 family glycosyl hydrolase [Halanaerobium saccharolyticum]TDO77220.1 chitobiose phosphorylase [Halanaerobium saccharolyticum]